MEPVVSYLKPVTSPLKQLVAQYVGVKLDDIVIALFILSIAIFFLLLIVRRLFTSRRKKGDSILLLGICNSGKTAMYHYLLWGKHVESVTSMTPNQSRLSLSSDRNDSVQIIDFPGHHRLREQLSSFIPRAAAVVFVVDAANLDNELKSVAQYLYDLWTNPIINKNEVPFLIALNKSDIPTAYFTTPARIKIEGEIEVLRQTRANTPAQEGVEREEIYLGIEGEKFRIEHLPFPVTFCECSVLKGNLKEITKFIEAHKP